MISAMSLNDISDSFSQYAKGNNKQCEHLKELFSQAIIQLEEEQLEEIKIEIIKKKKLSKK